MCIFNGRHNSVALLLMTLTRFGHILLHFGRRQHLHNYFNHVSFCVSLLLYYKNVINYQNKLLLNIVEFNFWIACACVILLDTSLLFLSSSDVIVPIYLYFLQFSIVFL